MEIFLSLIYSALFCYVLYRVPFFRVEGLNKHVVPAVFAVKLLSALALTSIYTFFYTDRSTADIFKYFDDAVVVFEALKHSPVDYFRIVSGIDAGADDLQSYYHRCNYWFKEFDYHLYNDNRTIIRFNALVMLFSFGHFFVHNVFACFVSLAGLVGIFKLFYGCFPGRKWSLVCSVFLLPSVLLWASGVLKESLVLGAFGLFLHYFWQCLHGKPSVSKVLFVLMFAIVLVLLKYYVIACASVGLAYVVALRVGFFRSRALVLLSLLAVCLLTLAVGQLVGGRFDILSTLSLKQNDFISFAQSLGNVGSLIDTQMLRPSLLDFLSKSPEALFNSFLRPLPWETNNILYVLPVVENLLLVVSLLMVVRSVIVNKTLANVSPSGHSLLLFSLLFVFFLNLLNGLTVPVLGALVRYKVPAMPFMFAALACLSGHVPEAILCSACRRVSSLVRR